MSCTVQSQEENGVELQTRSDAQSQDDRKNIDNILDFQHHTSWGYTRFEVRTTKRLLPTNSFVACDVSTMLFPNVQLFCINQTIIS